MQRRFVSVVSIVLALVGSVLSGPSAQAKPVVVKIQAGAIHPTNKDAPVEFTRFYPDVLKVRRGQTVRWGIFGFHTITFLKSGRTGFFRNDELPGTYAFPEKSALGTGCGAAAQPCVLTKKSTIVSSGFPFTFESFDVKVDVPPGNYAYFCQVHPAMSGAVEVVASNRKSPSQGQIDAQIKSAVRKDAAAVDKVFMADQVPTSKIDADGVRTWQVLLGDETPDHHAQIIAYLPTDLKIGVGDRVRYVYPERSKIDPHTVTFPAQASGPSDPPAGLAGLGILFGCDFDSPTDGLPGIPGLWAVMGPPCPASLEVLWSRWMTEAHPAPGNSVSSPSTFHDSATLFPKRVPKNFRTLPDTGRALPSSFEAMFPAAGDFSYQCNIHGDFMTGSVNVS